LGDDAADVLIADDGIIDIIGFGDVIMTGIQKLEYDFCLVALCDFLDHEQSDQDARVEIFRIEVIIGEHEDGIDFFDIFDIFCDGFWVIGWDMGDVNRRIRIFFEPFERVQNELEFVVFSKDDNGGLRIREIMAKLDMTIEFREGFRATLVEMAL
jgi:hypothetical protein